MAAPSSVANVAGSGDFMAVKALLEFGANPNEKSGDGMTPLAVAAFWGYDNIAQILLQHGADINAQNNGTLWTPLHCAAFQGHGKIIMVFMDHKPDIYKMDSQGRTAVDFASAQDSIWAFFAAAECKRTPKSDLVRMNIVRKASLEDPVNTDVSHVEFSRPDLPYNHSDTINDKLHADLLAAYAMGDVLAGTDDAQEQTNRIQSSLAIWNN